jgi:glycine/D-amino acid oxidase-like deaminating enzyme
VAGNTFFAEKTVWERSSNPVPPQKLSGNISAEVLVVGAGTTGSLVAEALAADGREVVVVDRETPATGSTSESTALLLFEIDQPLTRLAEKIGYDKAVRAWRRSDASTRRLTRKIRALGVDCDFVERPSLLLPGTTLGPVGLRRECEARVAIGLPSHIIERDELLRHFGIDRPCAILSENSAEVDPVKMSRGVLDAAIERGTQLLFPEEITALEPGEQTVVATTKSGWHINAEFVVLCCGFDVPKFISTKHHRVVSTWAIATRPQPENLWPSRALIWESADPYLYIRTTREGRVLIGGEDENHNDEARRRKRLPAKIKRLQSKFARLMPKIDLEIDYAWSGAFGASDTGLPAIGNVPGMPRVCAVLGFGGNGTTYAQVAAEMISNALRGAREPDIDLFAFPGGAS